MAANTTRHFPKSWLTAYATKGKLPAFTVPANNSCYLFNARAYNNSGSAQNVGILSLFLSGQYQLWSYVASGPTYTNVTASIGAGTNIFTGTANDGFLVQTAQPSGLIGMTVTTTTTGGVYTYKYWNGSAYATLGTLEVPAYPTAADIWIVFQPPADWKPGATASTVNQAMYTVWVQSTTGPSGAVAVNNLWAASFLELYQGVANNAAVQLMFPDSKPFAMLGGQGIIPYFSSPNAANQFAAFYDLGG